ncbi:MAG: hypothetical protein JXB30_07355 [Anaerolineae bacterium]|nr:hypothetical protein [Anaerolineae bacterium]
MPPERCESLERTVGYGFFERSRPTSPGYTKLQVLLCDKPGHGYYSPKFLRVSIMSKANMMEHLTVSHPWEEMESYQVTMDRVVLRDHQGRTIQAFTFGGELQVVNREDDTLCTLSSPAPILELVEDLSISTLFTTETEAALTTYRLAPETESTIFEQWMATNTPLTIYAASLQMVQSRLLEANLLDTTQVQLLRMISAEIAALEVEVFPDGLPTFKRIRR